MLGLTLEQFDIERDLSTPLVLGQPLELRHNAQSMDQLIQQQELSLEDRKKTEVKLSRHLEDGTLSLLIWLLDQYKIWVLYNTLLQNLARILQLQLVMSQV
jgi:hypothetical protein